MDLDRLVRDHGEHFRGVELGHGGVHVLHGALVVLPGGIERQEFGRAQLHGHVGEFERNALEFGDLLAELLAVDRPVEADIECAFGSAEARGCNLQPGGAQPFVGDVKSLVRLAQYLGGRDPAVVELENAVQVAPVGRRSCSPRAR